MFASCTNSHMMVQARTIWNDKILEWPFVKYGLLQSAQDPLSTYLSCATRSLIFDFCDMTTVRDRCFHLQLLFSTKPMVLFNGQIETQKRIEPRKHRYIWKMNGHIYIYIDGENLHSRESPPLYSSIRAWKMTLSFCYFQWTANRSMIYTVVF